MTLYQVDNTLGVQNWILPSNADNYLLKNYQVNMSGYSSILCTLNFSCMATGYVSPLTLKIQDNLQNNLFLYANNLVYLLKMCKQGHLA